ncbi:MAG TPA: N-acetyl sugar amidotransferase [Rhodospirillaceae bacterium]|nr:flagellin modification protein, PseA [Rhodospirillaceae bacterium]HAT35731.1 N-acetyl sugar amidotransferase [Rhodospirillaceae bacterium]
MQFCKSCLMPDTRPDLEFDETGICDACVMAENKHGRGPNPIDWDDRKRQFEEIVEKYRNPEGGQYDCIIPVSGGKDSTYQVHVAKNVYGLRPLCVCFEPTMPTKIGRKNLDNLNRMGVDLFHIKRNPIVYEKLIVECFKRVGDMEWANHAAIWSLPYRLAVAFDIPLIIWGEGRMEFAGNFFTEEKYLREMDEVWATDYGVLNGLRPEDLVSEELGINDYDMQMYKFPTKEELVKVGGNKGCLGIFLGFYFPWDSRKQVDVIEEHGWSRRRGRVEVTYADFENLDCLSMNLHDYVKYCKFGYGRATDDVSRDIRHDYMERDEAVRLVERYDGLYPIDSVQLFCEKFDMTLAEFDEICDSFTNPAIFEMKDGKFLKDTDRSLIMKPDVCELRRNP